MDYQTRAFLHIRGEERVSFLQGIVTNDVSKLNDDKIQFAALLSPQGKILHDMFLVAVDNAILIDTQAAYKDTLMKRLMMYKLRAKVMIEEVTMHDAPCAVHQPLPDPRHPELPPRDYTFYPNPESQIPNPSCSLGIPELGRDFEPDQIVALDAGYDLLHAVSFTKGCYVGQEVTARMHYKNIARRGFHLLESDLAPTRLALLKFEEVATADGRIVIDGITYRAHLPLWMQPKFLQWQANAAAPAST